ncbi:hypothetical protein ABL78_6076 [Leptomonas seymouri]|uniref:Protein kinase domain-containing protein n=1 Tax=Leptomonas seymouri TaxID=5684 RepID=A0A0N1IJ79_LEPSE|nr:hypothetical protein ABL78_6076 [Leptomonas seymouri]|eukprot:KPI84871.1 hypothetical protein ABL78_6076 [Leptomonas seymouri]
MDFNDSEASGSFVVHSEAPESVGVNDMHEHRGLSASMAGGGGDRTNIGDINRAGGHSGLGIMAAGRRPSRVSAACGDPSLPVASAAGGVGNADVGRADISARRLPFPKPVPLWSQVPPDSRQSPALYLLNRYGRGSGVEGAGAVVGLGDSFDAFKLYVADDGEMKMDNHHNDFYGFNYDATDDADDLINLQHRQLGVSDRGGDFYEDTDDSSYGSSDGVFDHGNAYVPGREAAYESVAVEDAATTRHSWGIEPALLSKNVSRRRRLPLKRRGGGLNGGGGGSVRRHRSKGKGRQRQRRPRDKLTKRTFGRQSIREKGGDGGGTARVSATSNQPLTHVDSTLRKRGRSGSGATPHTRPVVCVRPGAHEVAGAAAYPHLPASLGALVLLSPGTPTTNPFDKVVRLRNRLLQRQLHETREYEKKQRVRRTKRAHQVHAVGAAAAAPAGNKATPRTPGSLRLTGSGANSYGDSANLHTPHPVTDLKFTFDDLSCSVGPATARMSVGAPLSILRSARQRMRESPRLQEVVLKDEAVYVRADPAYLASAAAQRTDAGTQSGGKPSSAGRMEAMDGRSAYFAAWQLQEPRDPYTGAVIASSLASAEGQTVPTVLLSGTAGILFFHDPAAPRPFAIADVAQPLPLLLPTPTTTYVLPSSLQRPPANAVRRSSRSRHSYAQTPSSQDTPRPSSFAPTAHFNPSSSVSAHSTTVAAAEPTAEHNINNGGRVCEANFTRSSAGSFCDAKDRYERAETLTFCDAHLVLPHSGSDRRRRRQRDALSETLPSPLRSHSRQGPRKSARRTNGTSAVGALSVDGYRMPSIMVGGNGQRQRWRLHSGAGGGGGVSSVGFNDGSQNSNGGDASQMPLWQRLHGSLSRSNPITAASGAPGGGHNGQQGVSDSCQADDNIRNNNLDSRSAAVYSNVRKDSAVINGPVVAAGVPSQPLGLKLCGSPTACESDWDALHNASSLPRIRGAGSPQLLTMASTNAPSAAALPHYPSLVAPYAAPRTPLQQNVRYNAWTVDGVSASSGAACIVHIFTITREMLRSMYDYVAYRCARRREAEARERELARQRRMKDALVAGVLTRDLQRCLRCPHCGVVGQIVKAVQSRNTGQSQPPRSQLHSRAPRQLSQSVNQVRGMSNSPLSYPALRVSASASSFAMEAQKQHPHQPQAERGKHVLSSSERQPPQGLNMPPPLHAPWTQHMGSSMAHLSAAYHNNGTTDISTVDTVVMELPGHSVLHEAAVVAGQGEESAALERHGLRPATSPAAAAAAIGNKEGLQETESGATTTPATADATFLSPPISSGLPGQFGPLLPTSGTQYSRLFSSTQNMPSSRDNAGGSFATFSSQQPQPPSAATFTSRFVPFGSGTAISLTALSSSPNKRRSSSNFTVNSAAADSAESTGENQLEKSAVSHELSQSFSAPQLQRAANSQTEFQRSTASLPSINAACSVLPNSLLSRDFTCSASHANVLQACQEREEGSVRVDLHASDAAPGVPAGVNANSVGAKDDEEENDQRFARIHSACGPVGRPPVAPAQTLCSLLPEGYSTPPSTSMARTGSTPPNQVEFTMDGSTAAAAQGKRIRSPESAPWIHPVSSTLPPLSTYGGNPSFTTSLKARSSGQMTRPPPPPPLAPPAGNRASGNGSFVGFTQVSPFTPVVAPSAPSGTPLLGDAGANSNASNGNGAAQPPDPFGESMNAAVNRESFALSRRYVCQSCHMDVVPKTSMVSLAFLEDRSLPKFVNDSGTPTPKSGRTDTTRTSEPFGVLAFDDLFQDDALVHALQTYLQEALMLPATHPPRPSQTLGTPGVPEAASSAAAASIAPTNPRCMPVRSLFSNLEGPPKTDVKAPTPPAVSFTSAGLSVGRVSGGARATGRSSIDASRVRLPSALRHSGEATSQSSKEEVCGSADTANSTRFQLPQAMRPNTTTSSQQAAMPLFARLSLQSLTLSPSPSSVSSSARSKGAVQEDGEDREGHATPAGEDHSVPKLTTTPAAPLLLRLCVPCCGLKVSVLDFAKPKASAALPLLNGEASAVEVPSTTTTPAESSWPKTPLRRRKSVASDASEGSGKRLARKFSCPPPPTIPRMREDASTRGLTQSALLIKKEPPSVKRFGTEAVTTETQRGRSNKTTAAGVPSRQPPNRRSGRQTEDRVAARRRAAASSCATQDTSSASRAVMQDTDASKRHHVKVNSCVHLDATSIDRIWERVFMQGKSSAVAAVATGRDKERASRLRSFVEEAAQTPPVKWQAVNAESSRATLESLRTVPAAPSSTEPLAPADGAPTRTHQHLGIDLSRYNDSSVVLKVELAYPHLPGGNVRQLLHEWMAVCQPHPVLLEAVVRNIVYGVLTQLHTLHAAGYTSGNVKSTNVFPMWHLMKATKESGMKMPPRAAVAVAESRVTDDDKTEKDGRPVRMQDAFGSPRGNDALLQGAEHIGESPTKDAAAPSQPRRSFVLSPTSVILHESAKELPPSLDFTPAPSVGDGGMPRVHAAAAAVDALLQSESAQSQQQHQQQQQQPQKTPDVARHRCTTPTSLQATAAARRAQNENNNIHSHDASKNEEGVGRSAEEVRHRRSFASASIPLTPAAPMLKDNDAMLMTEALLMADPITSTSNHDGSGDGDVSPFSPALGMTSPLVPRRRGRGFSIDTSVIPIAPRWKNSAEAEGGRRTHSIGPADQRGRRRSESAHSRIGEDREDLVPLIVEAVLPTSTPAAATAAACCRGELPAAEQSSKTAVTSPRPPLPTAESLSYVTSRHGPPKRWGNHPSANSSPGLTFNEPAAWKEEAPGLRYICGAQLTPPGRVLLPSLPSCAGEAEAQKTKDDHNRKSSSWRAPLLWPPKEVLAESVNEGHLTRNAVQSLLSGGPTGAVPRPNPCSCSRNGSLSAKTTAASRGSKSETGSDGINGNDSSSIGGGDALDPLQWSQQVMLMDNLSTRVETALRLAMTKVLTGHPPYPVHHATQPDASADEKGETHGGRRASIQTSGALLPAAAERQQQQQRRADGAAGEGSAEDGGSRSGSPRERATGATSRARTPLGGAGSDKSFNAYVPDLSRATLPVQPVLFGIQEAEYVPAPETIRSAREEAKALCYLWQQQQQSSLLSAGCGDRNIGVATTVSEEAQMEYVVGKLAEQACSATTLRNTLDPYPHHNPAVDVWQLGMMALDLADGPVPTTWLKQRKPMPRLSTYPWSSYFQSFVSRCLQVSPEKRATTAELLHHPWFGVALVPQVAGGGGACSLRDNHLQPEALAQVSPLLPLHSVWPPRASCVMGVDCLTVEEQKEWEDFDYTLLYANREGVHPLAAAPGSPVSSVINSMSRVRRASANSLPNLVSGAAGIAVAAAGPDKVGSVHASGGGSGGPAASSAPADRGGVSQSLSIGPGSNIGGTSLACIGASANSNINHTVHNGGSINAAMVGAVDADLSAMSSVDLAQFFTRLVVLQWRQEQQQEQQRVAPSLAASFLRTSANRCGRGASAVAEAVGAAAPDIGGTGNALLNATFLDRTLSVPAEDVLTVLRRPSSSVRYLQLGSPRQSLYSMLSPRPPTSTAAATISQAQQTESVMSTPPLWSSHPFAVSFSGVPYGMPGALNVAGTALLSAPPVLSTSGDGGGNATAGSLSAYVPLRDPRIGGVMSSFSAAVAPTSAFAAGAGSPTIPPRWVNVVGETSPGTATMASLQGSQHGNSVLPFRTSARDTRSKCGAVAAAVPAPTGVDPRHAGLSAFASEWDGFSDTDRQVDREDVGDSSYGSSDSSSNEGDSSNASFGEQSSFSSSSNSSRSSSACAKADRAGGVSSDAHSNSGHSRGFVTFLDDSHVASRGGGEVPYRKIADALHDDLESRAPSPFGVQWTRDRERLTTEDANATGDRTPLSTPETAPTSFSTAAALSGRTNKQLQKQNSGIPQFHDDAGDEHRCRTRCAASQRRPHHMLFGTLATSLARLSTIVGPTSDTDSDESSDFGDCSFTVDGKRLLNDRSDSFPEGVCNGRRRTQTFGDSACEDFAPHTRHPATADAERCTELQHGSRACPKSASSSLSGLNHHTCVCSEDESSSSADEASGKGDSDSRHSVEAHCDEMLRCFFALQRGCPMAVSLWCLRVLQQAHRHPRTSAAAAQLMERVERDVSGGTKARNLAWLSAKDPLLDTVLATRQQNGDEEASTASSLNATAAGAAATTPEMATSPPQVTVPPVQDTCPSNFHNYELAKWLYAALQTVPRCT